MLQTQALSYEEWWQRYAPLCHNLCLDHIPRTFRERGELQYTHNQLYCVPLMVTHFHLSGSNWTLRITVSIARTTNNSVGMYLVSFKSLICSVYLFSQLLNFTILYFITERQEVCWSQEVATLTIIKDKRPKNTSMNQSWFMFGSIWTCPLHRTFVRSSVCW